MIVKKLIAIRQRKVAEWYAYVQPLTFATIYDPAEADPPLFAIAAHVQQMIAASYAEIRAHMGIVECDT